ncbi:MAG: exodeoxyribonuclease VII large subunit [bacterium]
MERTWISVSKLNQYLKAKFDADRNLSDILVKAEISNFKRHSRGHLYFSLKDESSQISAVMFAGNAASLAFEPKDGSKVFVQGYVTIYEPNGQYQIYVQKMTDAGKGDLYLEFERLKAKLETEGLFAADRKRSLPAFPAAVGVITSPTGAAVRDVIQIIGRRWPLTKIIIYPALVQGPEARDSLVRAITKANGDAVVDVLIVGRGGGSIEDLWPFNEEAVARAIFTSHIPIVSAVGHETDFTIADFVADLRAPTPSGAAEIVVPDRKTMFDRVTVLQRKVEYVVTKTVAADRERLQHLVASYVYQNPARLLEKAKMRLINLGDRLDRMRPEKMLADRRLQLAVFTDRLGQRIRTVVAAAGYRYGTTVQKLELVNPLAIMGKGYAIVRKNNHIVKTIADLVTGDRIDVKLADGAADCRVMALREDA